MPRKYWQLAEAMFKLGAISFGGPAAHIAMMEHEMVERRGWISQGRFLDLLGATHLIPGPNAVEMAAHIGYCRAGILGGLVAGLAFTLPAVVVTILLAWAYVQFGAVPQATALLAGIKPAMLGVIVAAIFRLGRTAVTAWPPALIALIAAVAVLAGADAVAVLIAAAVLGSVWLRLMRTGQPVTGDATTIPLLAAWWWKCPGAPWLAAASSYGASAAGGNLAVLGGLLLFFLKVGVVMYGGGYVLLAYIENGLVGPPWGLTQQHLLDAVAVGQITPGPMLSTATFVGYLLAGLPGAIAATLGILAPCFLFVAAINPLLPALRQSRWAALFLDAVNAASIGLMIAVTLRLGWATLTAWPAAVVASAAVALVLVGKVSPAWLVLAGAAIGPLLL